MTREYGGLTFIVEPTETPRGPGFLVEHVGPVVSPSIPNDSGYAQSEIGIVRIMDRIVKALRGGEPSAKKYRQMPYIRYYFRRPNVSRHSSESLTDVIEQELTPKGNFSKFILDRIKQALEHGQTVEIEARPEVYADEQVGTQATCEGAD